MFGPLLGVVLVVLLTLLLVPFGDVHLGLHGSGALLGLFGHSFDLNKIVVLQVFLV